MKSFNQMYNEAGIKRANTFHENKWDREQVVEYLNGKGMSVDSVIENEIKIKGIIPGDLMTEINDNTRKSYFRVGTDNTIIQLY